MPRYSLRTLLILLAIVPPLVAALLYPRTFAQEASDPGEALYGEWEIVELIFRATVQDFRGSHGGWFIFAKGSFVYTTSAEDRDNIKRRKGLYRRAATVPCVIRQREIDISHKSFPDRMPTKGIWELKDGKLRVVWCEGERPTEFDEALKGRDLTLFVLQKVK